MSDFELLYTLLARPIAFHPSLARLGGSATAGILLSQLFYWTDKSSHPARWIYKSVREWSDETTLTDAELRTARRALEAKKVIEVDVASNHFESINAFDRQLCYRINLKQLYLCLCAANGSQSSTVGEDADLTNGSRRFDKSKASKRQIESADLANQCTESTHKTTTTAQVAGGVPGEWLEAAKFELGLQPHGAVKKPSAYIAKILARYKASSGPDAEILALLAERERKALEQAERKRAEAARVAEIQRQADAAAHVESVALPVAKLRKRVAA